MALQVNIKDKLFTEMSIIVLCSKVWISNSQTLARTWANYKLDLNGHWHIQINFLQKGTNIRSIINLSWLISMYILTLILFYQIPSFYLKIVLKI